MQIMLSHHSLWLAQDAVGYDTGQHLFSAFGSASLVCPRQCVSQTPTASMTATPMSRSTFVGRGGHGRQEYIQDLKRQTCQTTPALEGVTDHRWTIVELLRGAYPLPVTVD
jgi:hypothetical protein